MAENTPLTEEAGRFRLPKDGEVLSSYLDAWRGHFHVSLEAFEASLKEIDATVLVAIRFEPDYPIHPGWRSALARVTNLQQSVFDAFSAPIGPWALLPGARTGACLQCLEMASSPVEQYREELWIQSNLSICLIHGCPLVEMPAIGWGWAKLPSEYRRRRRSLMTTPGVARQALSESWLRVSEDFQRAVYFAEMTCWAASTNHPILEVMNYPSINTLTIWTDLLTLLCASWEPFAAPSIATLGIPASLCNDHTNSRFGGKNRSILLEEPTFVLFRHIASPAERRPCILIAWDAIMPEYSKQIFPRGIHSNFGWLSVVRRMPDRAWDWLLARTIHWPSEWKMHVDVWTRERFRTRRTREARRWMKYGDE